MNAMVNWLGQRLAAILSKPSGSYRSTALTHPDLLARTLRPGDVILVDGSTRASGFIKYLTQSIWSHAALFVGIGSLGGLGHLILMKAYDHAPASRLAPFSYSQLIWVAAIGFFAFGEFPDAWSLLGIAILVASGIYIASHQRRSERRLRKGKAETPHAD